MKKRILSILLTLVMVIGMLPTVAHAYVGEIETITDEELLEVMEVDLRIGHEIIASSESTSFSKMSNPGHWELKLSKQENENRTQYYIVLHLYNYDVADGYIDFMYDMKPAADTANRVSFQVSVHGDCQVGFIRALTTDKEKVYGSSLDIIFAAGATLDTKQISHRGTGQWGSDVELNLRGVPGQEPGILYTKEIINSYYFIDWPQNSDVVTYADNLIIINYDTPPNGGPLFTHGEDFATATVVQFTETVDLFLNTRSGQFPIFEEHTNEKLAQKYQYIEDDGITAFSDLRAHLWFKESGDPADEYTVGDSFYYYFFPELTMLDYLFKAGINEQFKGGTRGFKVESSYELTNLSQRAVVASDTVVGIEEEYSYEKDNFVKVAGKNGEEYFTFETPGLYELRSSVKLMHNGHTVDSVGEVYHFYVNPAPAVLDGIEITRSAASMAHVDGQEFDKSKIEVTAKYSDGTSKVLDADDYDVTYQNGTTLKTGDTSVTISYTEDGVTKTATQTVSVADALHAFEFKSLDDLDFGTVEVGYPSVAYKNIIVKNTGSDFINLDYKISDTSKFRLSPYSDDLNAIEEGTSHTLQVHPVDGLPAGVYNETIRVYGMGALAGQEHTFNLKFVVSDGHEHTYTTDFNKSNEFYHWRECTDPACTASDKGRKDVTPHNWDIEHPVVVDPATCTEDGVGKIECTICDAYQNTTVYATGHDWGEWPSYITPRCNEAPITITRTCENDESHTDSKTINGIHMAMDWTTDETHHWKVCGYCETEILVEKDAHKDTNSDNKCDVCEYDMTPAVAPTKIDSITIEGLPAPQYGMGIQEYDDNVLVEKIKNGSITVNGQVCVDDAFGNIWFDGARAFNKDENVPEDYYTGAKFEEDTYYLGFWFMPATGYTFADDLSATVDGVNNADVSIKDAEDDWIVVWIKYEITAPSSAPTEYDITVTGGTASANKAVAGASVTITANAPESGKQFKEWTGADSLNFTSGSKTSATATFTMPAGNVNVTATYEDIPPVEPTKYTVSFDANGGTGTMTPVTVESGTKFTLPANGFTAPYGKVFQAWYVGGNLLAPGAKITVTDNTTVKAIWEDDNSFMDDWYWALIMLHSQKFDITATASEGGEIDPEGVTKVQYSKNITYTITPDAGYAIKAVFVDGKDVGAVSEYTFKNVTKKHTIHALFEQINPYTDVKAGDWFYDDVLYVTLKDLMNGTGNGKFSPEITTDRAMLVTVLWRLEGCPVVDSSVAFDDVADGLWYSDAIDWASANGIVNGYGNGKFGPTDQITREQIMAILNRYAAYKNWTDGTALPMIPQYNCSIWAENNVIWADMNGLLNGLGVDITDMTAKASRAELAAYLARFYKAFAEN